MILGISLHSGLRDIGMTIQTAVSYLTSIYISRFTNFVNLGRILVNLGRILVYFIFLEKTSLDISCESTAKTRFL